MRIIPLKWHLGESLQAVLPGSRLILMKKML